MKKIAMLIPICILLAALTAQPVSAVYSPFDEEGEYAGVPVPVLGPVDIESVNAQALQVAEGSTRLRDNIAFTDVKGHWAMSDIVSMAAQSVIRGYGDRRFRPDDPVSRQEAIALLVRIMGGEDRVQRQTADGSSELPETIYLTCGHADI